MLANPDFVSGFCSFTLIFQLYVRNEAHKQYSRINIVFEYNADFGPPGKHLYINSPNPLPRQVDGFLDLFVSCLGPGSILLNFVLNLCYFITQNTIGKPNLDILESHQHLFIVYGLWAAKQRPTRFVFVFHQKHVQGFSDYTQFVICFDFPTYLICICSLQRLVFFLCGIACFIFPSACASIMMEKKL